MHLATLSIIAFATSVLTFYSGFGLGTILLPVFVLYFPPEIAVAITAIVHLANNVFKFFLVGRATQTKVLLRFGVPALIGAAAGAFVLSNFEHHNKPYTYEFFSRNFTTSPIAITIGALMICFAAVELSPTLKNWKFDPRFMPLGGIISGFFGGLSGHQGAFRTMFLVKAGLSKEQFIATGVAIAVVVDIIRLVVYGVSFDWSALTTNLQMMIAAILSAFFGSVLAQKFLKKLNIQIIQFVIGIMLILFGFSVALGTI